MFDRTREAGGTWRCDATVFKRADGTDEMGGIVAVSLKMYFDRVLTTQYIRAVARAARETQAIRSGEVTLAVLPDFLTLALAADELQGTGVSLGAQDLCHEDRGPFTGEVSGRDLAELGCRCVEIGHAERRALFAEDDALVSAKMAAALRNKLIPLLCIGETVRTEPAHAAAVCLDQVRSALGDARTDQPVWLAYEPVWAIGARNPAAPGHVREVCQLLREQTMELLPAASIIYGGSAGPGLLEVLGPAVDGLFLGRFAHDPAALFAVVEEARRRCCTA